jgi:hypothetical protein
MRGSLWDEGAMFVPGHDFMYPDMREAVQST